MSSSDGEPRFGTIFMGPTPDRETTLDRLYDVTQRELWNQQTEQEYLERVKAKATERVRALLLQARQRGDAILREAERQAGALRSEAEDIRAEAERALQQAEAVRHEAETLRGAAHGEGFEAGRAEALAELSQARRELGEATGAVLLGIHEQCGHIFEAWRGDMAALLREAVEKATGWVVDEDRAAVLEQLLDRGIRALLDRRHFTVRVNPVDAALVTDMLADAHRAAPRVDNWELATDPELEPGSLIVESDSGLADNSRGARRSVVDEVLEHLSLPVGQADQDAFAGVTHTLVEELRKNGVQVEDDGEAAAPPGAEEEARAQTAPEAAAPARQPAPGEIAPGETAPEPSAPRAASPVPPISPASSFPASPPDVAEPEPVAEEAVSAAPQAGAAPGDSPADDLPAPPAPGPAMPESSVLSDLSDQEARDMVRTFLEPDETAAAVAPDSAGGVSAKGEGFSSRDETSAPEAPDQDEEFQAEGGLPPDVADELLADMGFAPGAGPSSSGNEQPERV